MYIYIYAHDFVYILYIYFPDLATHSLYASRKLFCITISPWSRMTACELIVQVIPSVHLDFWCYNQPFTIRFIWAPSMAITISHFRAFKTRLAKILKFWWNKYFGYLHIRTNGLSPSFTNQIPVFAHYLFPVVTSLSWNPVETWVFVHQGAASPQGFARTRRLYVGRDSSSACRTWLTGREFMKMQPSNIGKGIWQVTGRWGVLSSPWGGETPLICICSICF